MATKLVQSQQSHGVRLVAGRVDVVAGVPSVGAGDGFSVVDTAPGQVQVVLNDPGKSFLSIHCDVLEPTDATGYAIKIDTKVEASSVLFGIYVMDAVDGALVDDVSFYFTTVLSDID